VTAIARRLLGPLVLVLCAALAGCGGSVGVLTPALSVAGFGEDEPVGRKMIGKPYKVGGKWYHPSPDEDYDKTGLASWYGPKFHGRETANGERFNQNALTAAHPTLPLPSYVRVTVVRTGKSAVLRVNDRGPFKRGRIIDVSKAAAEELGFRRAGRAQVRVEYLGPAEVGGGDKETLVAARKFGTSGGKGNDDARSVRDFLPFGLGGNGAGDADAGEEGRDVEVRLASAEAQAPRARSAGGALPGVAKRYTERTGGEPASAAAYVEEDEPTGAIDAVIALNAEAAEEPIAPQPLPETSSAASEERVSGAHDLFDTFNDSGISTLRGTAAAD